MSGLTAIVDSLGLEPPRRRVWREAAARSSLPAHAYIMLRGVSTVPLALPDLDKPDDLLALAALNNP